MSSKNTVPKTNSLASAPTGADGATAMGRLPYDILRVVLVLVGPLNAYRLSQVKKHSVVVLAIRLTSSQVSQKYRGLWQDKSLWKDFAQQAVLAGRILVFDAIEDVSNLKLADIRRALIRSDMLYQAWNYKLTNRSRPCRHKEKRLYTGFLDSLTTTPSIDRYTVMPYNLTDFLEHALLVVGPTTDMRFLDLPGDLSFHPHYRPGTHFVTLNDFQRVSDAENRKCIGFFLKS